MPIFHSVSLPENAREREELAKGQSLGEFRSLVERLRDRFLPYHEGYQTWHGQTNGTVWYSTYVQHFNILPVFLI